MEYPGLTGFTPLGYPGLTGFTPLGYPGMYSRLPSEDCYSRVVKNIPHLWGLHGGLSKKCQSRTQSYHPFHCWLRVNHCSTLSRPWGYTRGFVKKVKKVRNIQFYTFGHFCSKQTGISHRSDAGRESNSETGSGREINTLRNMPYSLLTP